MLILGTDHMSLLQRGGTEGERIRSRLRSVPLDDVATTVVTYEEQTRGWLASCTDTTLEQQVLNYVKDKKKLLLQSDWFCAIGSLLSRTGPLNLPL